MPFKFIPGSTDGKWEGPLFHPTQSHYMRTFDVNISEFTTNSRIVTRIKRLKKPNGLFSELHNAQWRYSPLLHVC